MNKVTKCDRENELGNAEYISEIEQDSLNVLENVKKAEDELKGYYKKILDGEYEEETRGRIASFGRASSNLYAAFTKTLSMSDELSARHKDLQKQNKKRRLIKSAPANSTIDALEAKKDFFAEGINIYKLLWICFIGCFVGVVIEILYCYISNGYIESRAGLVWGPFNLLYGAGAVVMSAALYKYRNRGSWISFIGGFLVGSVVEYLCSWAQELAFGSRSWDYSHLPLNINGRICLLYSVMWGVLGVLWIKELYPRLSKLILKIPNRVGKISTWVITVFFIVNSIVSVIAVYRWSERVEGVEAQNAFWELVDDRFPDERMEFIYPNMEFGKEQTDDLRKNI